MHCIKIDSPNHRPIKDDPQHYSIVISIMKKTAKQSMAKHILSVKEMRDNTMFQSRCKTVEFSNPKGKILPQISLGVQYYDRRLPTHIESKHIPIFNSLFNLSSSAEIYKNVRSFFVVHGDSDTLNEDFNEMEWILQDIVDRFRISPVTKLLMYSYTLSNSSELELLVADFELTTSRVDQVASIIKELEKNELKIIRNKKEVCLFPKIYVID